MATNIIDPNDINASPSLVNLGLNAAPDYSDMFIFAELTAQRRTASILTTGGVGRTTLDTAEDAVKINMMGFDQDSGQYTTKWTNNLDGTAQTPFEGFGITSINIKTDSSYMPMVDIEFVDIRGLSLITLGTKSPYSVIYSFPPPIFTLTVKGYYGKAISYNLHLVKQNTRFDATSGNYFINASFVAQRYAPLTDVLFKYVDIIPLMKDGVTPGGESNIGMDFNYALPPKNTRELITRAKKLYDDIDQFKVDSEEASELNKIKDSFTESQILINQIANFNTFVSTDLQSNFKMVIINEAGTYDSAPGSDASTNDSMVVRVINRLQVYDEAIKGFSPDERNDATFNQRLCLLYEYAEKVNNGQDNNMTPAKIQQVKDVSKSLRNNLLREAQRVNSKIEDNSIRLFEENRIQPFKGKKYLGIDITKMYLGVRQDLVAKQQEYATKNKDFKDKINDIAERSLGFVPTIRNVFGIITNDVETVFNDLREVCKSAEAQHVNNFNQIVANNNTTKKFISAFPLILKNTAINDSGGNSNGKTINRTERAYPGEAGLGFEDAYFPEVEFVENFITTFLNIIKSEQIENLKESVDQDGNNKWLPVNPLDSVVNGRLNADSPYKNTYKVIGGVDEKSVVTEMLNRYYIASQYSYTYLFYEPDSAALKDIGAFFGLNIQNKNDDLVKYVAQAEATNLVNSIVDATLLSSLETQATSWGKSIDNFYTTLSTSAKNYDNFDGQIDPNFGDAYVLINGQKITKNRLNEEYRGFEMLFSQPVLRNPSNAGTSNESNGQVNIVEEFIEKVGDTGIIKDIIFDSHGFDDFTKQNIAYIKDEANSENYDSDFIENQKVFGFETGDNTLLDRFAVALGYSDTRVKQFLTDPNITTDIKAFYTLQNICGALTYYHKEVNKKFALPAVIEVPKFAHLNMGAMAYFFNDAFPLPPATETAKQYVTEKYGIQFSLPPYDTYINNIAKNDVDLLNSAFVDFIEDTSENGFTSLNNKILALIAEITALNIPNSDPERKQEQYKRRLEPSGDLNSQTETDYSSILVKYITKLYLLNYTEVTFLPTNLVSDDDATGISNRTFIPLSVINSSSSRNKQINDNYFGQFFKEVIRLCEEKKQNLNKIEANFQQSIQDNDIKTQTYYSFKAIADKWVVGLDDTFAYGNQRPLIDLSPNSNHANDEFLFIDRFFNDIGDKVIIDFRPIVDLSQDYDVSVFTVLSKILALNGFEFFPIQNFLNFQQDEWQKSFKTYGSSRELIRSQTPAFICMYIGGTSSQLDDQLSGFEDDGFKDEAALQRSQDYSDNVKGFKVGFARQNQTMFTSIELNTNEHKETNESLAILSEIAQDQSASSPVPKGQNLFSTYEQRSYTCKVQGFGNAMIQPTQYFLLENVPMFNGAYLILSVEHALVANSMKTSFTGVRVRTNPNPLVTEFSTSAGIKAGDSDAITNGVVNEAGVSASNGTNRNNPNSTGSAGFNNNSIFPTNPTITRDMTGRLISPDQ